MFAETIAEKEGQIVGLMSEVETLQAALMESLILQSHYAAILNAYDGGERLTFATPKEWIERLRSVGKLKS